MEWKTDNLENLLDTLIDYRGKTPKKTTFGVPLVTAKIIKNGVINDFSEYIAEEDYDKWMVRGFPQAGDVVLTTEAPLGEVAQLSDIKIALAQRVVCLRGKTNILDNTYLKYYFLSERGKRSLSARETGTTVTGIKQSELRKVEVIYPSIDDQRRIASILSSLDKKIETNNKINAKLEEMAQAIFKNWFVDFAPFKDGKFVESELGMIPEGWRVGTLSEVIDIKYGKDHKKLEEGEIPVYGSGGLMRKVSKSLYNGESVLIPRKGTLNNILYVNEEFWTVDTMFYTLPKIQSSMKYVYQYIRRFDFTKMNEGTSIPSTTTATLNGLQVLLPSILVLKKFDELLSPMYSKIRRNNEENARLASIRDTLLPRLMSGEIEV